MTVLVIRAHTRFAVCRKARLHLERGGVMDALLIELSLDGCRVGISGTGIAVGDTLRLAVSDAEPLEARVRWRDEGRLGLRFARPLHVATLDTLVRLCRGESEEAQALSA